MAEKWEFEAAVGCFRVINTSLRCVYAGDAHMYRVLASQLRILLCDSNRRKDNSLLPRLFKDIEISPLQRIRFYKPGQFPKRLSHLNSLHVAGGHAIEIACMPFEVIKYYNGVEICQPLLDEEASPIPLTEWVDQLFTVQPVPLSIRSLIRVVADRDGGAHVHHKEDALLKRLKENCPTKASVGALIIIGLAKIMQEVGWAVLSHFEQYGTTGNLSFRSTEFTEAERFDQSSAQVPSHYYKHPLSRFNLLSISNAGA